MNPVYSLLLLLLLLAVVISNTRLGPSSCRSVFYTRTTIYSQEGQYKYRSLFIMYIYI